MTINKLGWTQIARRVFKSRASANGSWFTEVIKPMIEQELDGEFSSYIPIEEKEAFIVVCQKVYLDWRTLPLPAKKRKKTLKKLKKIKKGLSLSAERKLNAAIKAYRKQIDLQQHEAIREELEKILPIYKAKAAIYDEFNNKYEGIFTQKEYKQLVSVLHTDRYGDIDDVLKKRLETIFDMIQKKELQLCGLRGSTNTTGSLPTSVSDLMKMRRVRK